MSPLVNRICKKNSFMNVSHEMNCTDLHFPKWAVCSSHTPDELTTLLSLLHGGLSALRTGLMS